MKSLLALLLLTLPASAADLGAIPRKAPPPAVTETYSWTGIYLNGYADYGINFANTNLSMPGTSILDVANAPHGPGVGGELKLLWQIPSSAWVVGASGSIGYANMSGTANVGGLGISDATNYLGAVNALLGLTLGNDNRLLAYATGGLGFGGAKPNLAAIGTSQGINDTSVGWDVGAGLAYAITSNLNIFIEGDYFDLGTKSFTVNTLTGLPAVTNSTKFNILEQKIGLGIKF